MKKIFSLLTILCIGVSFTLSAQDKYQTPPEDLTALYMAQPIPLANFNGDMTKAVITKRASQFLLLQDIVNMDEYKIGGVRINARNFSESRYTTVIKDLYLISVPAGTPTEVVGLPSNPNIFEVRWSPSGKYFAFLNYAADEVELYRVDATAVAPVAKKINSKKVNAIFSHSFVFLDDERILYKSVPDGIGSIPDGRLPEGPIIQRNGTKKGKYRTYQDMIGSKSDEDAYDWLCTSVFAIWNGADGSTKTIGENHIVRRYSLSPDGNYLMVTTEHKPYSYSKGHNSFPSKLVVMDTEGNELTVLRGLPKKPADGDKPKPKTGDKKPKEKKPTKEHYVWRADQSATITWIETLPKVKKEVNNDPDNDIDVDIEDEAKKDEPTFTTSLWQCAAPFNIKEDKQMLVRSEYPMEDIYWGNDKLAIYAERSKKEKMTRYFTFNPSDTSKAPVLITTVNNAHDTLGVFPALGKPYTARGKYNGYTTLVTDAKNSFVLFFGKDRPDANGDQMFFMDCITLKNGKRTNLWTGKAPWFEEVTRVISATPSKIKFISRRQSNKEVPNYYIAESTAKGKVKYTPITKFENPLPQLADVQDTFIEYTREDGVKLSSRLFLPAGYDPAKDGKLPVVMWTYPHEYRCAAEAEKYRNQRYTFPIPGRTTHIAWATKGYAVLQGFSMPIISKTVKGQPNDDFVHQIVMNAEAAINYLDSIGIGDKNRVAVGGHSYGSFMTVNLMAHSKLFKAGLAESGAFNRSLTPFGFQNESRTYWKAKKVYDAMSPFNYPDSISGHILFVHGTMDENTGTHPIQSERMYYAAAGAGKDVDYLQLPYEGHGYVFKENCLHLFSEFYNMLEKYVKNAKVDEPEK